MKILQEEKQQLRKELLRLHETVGKLMEEKTRASQTAAKPARDISLAPAGPPPSLLRRVLGGLRRRAARGIRGLIALVHPCQERIRSLEFQAAATRPTLLRPHELRCFGPEPDPALLEDLCWLLSLENVDGVRLGESFVQRPECETDLSMPAGPTLLEAARKLGSSLIVRDLAARPEASTEDLILHPTGLGEIPAFFGGGAYGVALPASTRAAILLLGTDGVEFDQERRAFNWALLLGRELVCGLETRVFSAVRALGPGLVISLAETSALGRKRLRDLELMGCESHDFGSILHAAVRPGAFVSAIRGSGASAIWAIGGEELDVALDLLQRAPADIRIVREDPEGDGSSIGEQLSVSPLSSAEDVCVIPTPGAELKAPTAGRSTHHKKSEDVWTILVVDDLVPEARPEDAILLASQLQQHGSFEWVWVGEGPMAGRTDELQRLFGLENFRRRDPSELGAALDQAQVLCVLGESPYLPRAAGVAVAAALPLLSVRGNELEAFVDSESLTFAGRPGDLDAMSRAILEISHHTGHVAPLQLPNMEEFTENIRRILRG